MKKAEILFGMILVFMVYFSFYAHPPIPVPEGSAIRLYGARLWSLPKNLGLRRSPDFHL
jgi:hypothetical protein